MANIGYTPGKKAQYGKVRWQRYERLRAVHFTKYEARELSRIWSDDPVIQKMAASRKALWANFHRVARREGWTGGTATWHWYRGLRSWYRRHKFVTEGQPTIRHGKTIQTPKGLPSVFAWFRTVEQHLAAKDRMPVDEYQRRKRKTPLKFQGSKGNVRLQQTRAKARARAYREGKTTSITKDPRKSQVRQWIHELEEQQRVQPERYDQLEQQKANLKTLLKR